MQFPRSVQTVASQVCACGSVFSANDDEEAGRVLYSSDAQAGCGST
jgi:hypothetical protein